MAELRDIVARMAAREAAAHLLWQELMETSPGVIVSATPPTVVRPLVCAVCGTGPEQVVRHYPQPDLECWRVVSDDLPVPAGTSVLLMLSCEWLTARALLPTVIASARFGSLMPLTFRTRAVAWALQRGGAVDERIGALDASEAWVSALHDDVSPALAIAALSLTLQRQGALTVPASSRRLPTTGATAQRIRDESRGLASSMVSPHRTDPAITGLEDYYAEIRRTTAIAAFA
ncbi:MAG TPA: hypothetical protein DGT23_00710 [Micromonosporaceae bacterium]|nr:hypothetical protein [Micromonosporaceae bacterium]